MLPARLIPAHLTSAEPALLRQDMAVAMPAMISASRLGRGAPPRWLALLSAHRYLELAVSLNLPANAVVGGGGGGGGIALLCGMSGQFARWAYLLTIAIATSPVPILMLTGLLSLDPAAGQSERLQGARTWLEHLFGPAPAPASPSPSPSLCLCPYPIAGLTIRHPRCTSRLLINASGWRRRAGPM